MKSRAGNDKTNSSRAVAHDVGQTQSSQSPTYQINDRRAASVMQRKLRNLANGLVSANIIDRHTAGTQSSLSGVDNASPANTRDGD